MRQNNIDITDNKLESFCKRNGIVRLALFGSVLRDDFGPESDIDILVEFAQDALIGFFDLTRMEQELGELLGRRCEFHTYKGLHPLYKDEVIRTAEVRFEQA
jgi:predicted nucleotidyltransferase